MTIVTKKKKKKKQSGGIIMLELERKGREVFCKGRKLTIVEQKTKGPNKEVVKVDGLEGSKRQKG